MSEPKRITLTRREDRYESSTIDVTGWDERSLERMWDGLVMKVNFEEWEPVYSPERHDDETLAEWVRR